MVKIAVSKKTLILLVLESMAITFLAFCLFLQPVNTGIKLIPGSIEKKLPYDSYESAPRLAGLKDMRAYSPEKYRNIDRMLLETAPVVDISRNSKNNITRIEDLKEPLEIYEFFHRLNGIEKDPLARLKPKKK